MQAERVESDERVTRLESIIGELERQSIAVRASRRADSREAEAERSRLEAERDAALEGRTWARVREEERRTAAAEAARDEAHAEMDELRSELHDARGAMRNHKTSGAKQELAHAKGQVKELQEKLSLYEMRKNRKFYDFDPISEENESLRAKLEETETERRRLHSIVNPGASMFYSSRETAEGKLIGGRRVGDDFELLSMGLSVYNVPSNNVKPVIESIARFLHVELPVETITVNCRKQGIKKQVTRSLVPSSRMTRDALELGGEVADLVTYTEIAEGTSLGLTFDGATIAAYPVFGGGVCIVKKDGKVVRRMAFAEHMTRETVVEKMRKIQEFFARGKCCLEILQHPLADQVDLDRVRASVSDRGGADGKVANALKTRCVRSVQRELGRKAWEERDLLEREAAILALYSSWAVVLEAWEAAQALHDDDELNNRAAGDPRQPFGEYVPKLFDTLWETSQEILAAQQMLGIEAYDQLSEDEKVKFVALYCLEHGLS